MTRILSRHRRREAVIRHKTTQVHLAGHTYRLQVTLND